MLGWPGAQQSLVVCVDRLAATTWLCCDARLRPTPAKCQDYFSHDQRGCLVGRGAQQSLVVCVDRLTATTWLCGRRPQSVKTVLSAPARLRLRLRLRLDRLERLRACALAVDTRNASRPS
jgi:hypothetical protein